MNKRIWSIIGVVSLVLAGCLIGLDHKFKSDTAATINRLATPVHPQLPPPASVIVLMECYMPVLYIVTSGNRQVIVSYPQMLHNGQLNYFVGRTISDIELHGGKPLIVYMDALLGRKCV